MHVFLSVISTEKLCMCVMWPRGPTTPCGQDKDQPPWTWPIILLGVQSLLNSLGHDTPTIRGLLGWPPADIALDLSFSKVRACIPRIR
jgi:hypothetical protein